MVSSMAFADDVQETEAAKAAEVVEDAEAAEEDELVTEADDASALITSDLRTVEPVLSEDGEIVVGDYSVIEIPADEVEVTEEEVNSYIDSMLSYSTSTETITEGTVENGDTANIDFSGVLAGEEEPFEGGTAQGYDLILGSGMFIPGFEDQVIGHEIGETFDINVTFPEEYHAENLKGKEAVFKCRLNDIKVKELPEADDEFASEVSDFDTLEEYKADIRKNLEESKTEEAKRAAKNQLVDEAAANAQMIIPGPMTEMEAYQVAENFQMRMQSQGISMEQYFQITGLTPEKFIEDSKPAAERNIRQRLTLEAIAQEEGLEVTDEDLENEIHKMAQAYQMDYEQLNKMITDEERESMKKDVLLNKAADLLYENGVEVERPAEEENTDASVNEDAEAQEDSEEKTQEENQ